MYPAIIPVGTSRTRMSVQLAAAHSRRFPYPIWSGPVPRRSPLHGQLRCLPPQRSTCCHLPSRNRHGRSRLAGRRGQPARSQTARLRHPVEKLAHGDRRWRRASAIETTGRDRRGCSGRFALRRSAGTASLAVITTVDDAVVAACRLEQSHGRAMLGIIGPPGAGKSTLAAAIAAAIGPSCSVVPMDGFHLGDAVLRAHGALARQGSDRDVRRLGLPPAAPPVTVETERTVYAPGFERTLEQPIAAAIEVPPQRSAGDHRRATTCSIRREPWLAGSGPSSTRSGTAKSTEPRPTGSAARQARRVRQVSGGGAFVDRGRRRAELAGDRSRPPLRRSDRCPRLRPRQRANAASNSVSSWSKESAANSTGWKVVMS